MRKGGWFPIATALVVLPLQATASPASSEGDWRAFHGCWRAAESGRSAPLVCVLPGADRTSVRIATIHDGEVTEEAVVRADGVARAIEDGGCKGTETAMFSADGRRVYTRADLACDGLGRTTTGVLALVSEQEWVDAQALTVNGQHASRSVRYRMVAADEVPAWVAAALPQDQQLALEAARLNAATPLDVDAVIEASRHIAAPAVEALLAERRHGYGLNGSKLARLADAKVPTSTIDLMVALSYPQKFVVEQQRPSARTSDVDAWGARTIEDDYRAECYDPYTASRRYACDRYGYSRGGLFGYSPYGNGYSPWGYDRNGWYYGSTPVVIIQPGDNDGEVRGGQLVKGRGYTRSGSSRGTASPRGADSTRGAPMPSASKPGSGSSGASSSGSGSSAGSSSTGSGSEPPTRTAKPRGGGN